MNISEDGGYQQFNLFCDFNTYTPPVLTYKSIGLPNLSPYTRPSEEERTQEDRGGDIEPCTKRVHQYGVKYGHQVDKKIFPV